MLFATLLLAQSGTSTIPLLPPPPAAPADLALTTLNPLAFLSLVIVLASFVATMAVVIQQRIGGMKRDIVEGKITETSATRALESKRRQVLLLSIAAVVLAGIAIYVALCFVAPPITPFAEGRQLEHWARWAFVIVLVYLAVVQFVYFLARGPLGERDS